MGRGFPPALFYWIFMIVKIEDLKKVITDIHTNDFIAIDTETTGTYSYHGDKLFSIICSTRNNDYYFSFNTLHKSCLPREIIPTIFAGYKGKVFMHNAKFDMRMLDIEGVDISKLKIICTMATARVDYNDHLNLSLGRLAKLVGMSKMDKEIKEYLVKNNLFFTIDSPGKIKEKKYHYQKVPLSLMHKYGVQDGQVTFELGHHLLASISSKAATMPSDRPSLMDVWRNECRLTPIFYQMEKVGVKIDGAFVERAMGYEAKNTKTLHAEFKKLSGEDFKDSNKLFSTIFAEMGIHPSLTEKGNPSFNDSSLREIKHPIARLIEDIRTAKNRYSTYDSFLFFADSKDVIHSNVKQHGCVTGRVSYSNPPLQCMEKSEDSDEEFLIRRSFVPRDGYTFFMLDFDQFEYRMLLNYADETKLIGKILDGLDVHTATAEMINTDRKTAKTVNFMLLYGGGNQKLADSLSLSLTTATDIKNKYFDRLPKVKRFITRLTDLVRNRGYMHNWFGRRYYIDRDHAYKSANYIIQGGCADWIKVAMYNIHNLLAGYKSRMLLQVHDELLFEVHNSEFDLVPKLKEIMESVSTTSPHGKLPYTVGIDYSKTSWQDKESFDG